jgi:hypothetical protein
MHSFATNLPIGACAHTNFSVAAAPRIRYLIFFIEQHRPQFTQRSLYQPVLVRMPLVSRQRMGVKMSDHAVLFMK